ncbi:MAG: prohibitin family protein, partial [bacterium]
EYITRTETIHFTADNSLEGPDDPIPALSKDALGITVEISVQYRLDSAGLIDLHSTIGPDYKVKIVVPAIRESVRDVIARHTATNAATSEREQIKDEIKAMLVPMLEEQHIIVQQVLLRDLHLPDQVVQSINDKISAQQDSEKMVYVLAKSTQEKERVKIEAEAQAARITIIDQALAANPNYLNWLAIDKLNDNVSLIISDGKTILNLDAMKARGVPQGTTGE